MAPLTLFSPAKLNLFLAITGRRHDGFHELVSLVAPVDFGDTLTVDMRDDHGADHRFVLTCTDTTVPSDPSNLVLRAANAFAAATGWSGGANFHVEKRIPMGAGLGGGSSNGATALRALNTALGQPLDDAAMNDLAASLGSDCPLFLRNEPVIMRGRGERVEPLDRDVAGRLRGRRVLLFKPGFAVPTAWAYRRLAELARAAETARQPDVYLRPDAAETKLADWIANRSAPPAELLFNSLEAPAFEKFIALPTMLELLHRQFGLAPRMTGSGSACFAFLPEGAPVGQISAAIRGGWGDSSFVVETRMA